MKADRLTGGPNVGEIMVLPDLVVIPAGEGAREHDGFSAPSSTLRCTDAQLWPRRYRHMCTTIATKIS